MACGKIMAKIRVYTTKELFVKQGAIVLNNDGISGMYYCMADSKIKVHEASRLPGCLHALFMDEKTV